MKFSKHALAFFVISTATTTSEGLSAEDIKKTVGAGCSNTVTFRSFFTTDAGDACSSCFFCNDSHLSSLFDPTVESTCINCGTAENNCNSLVVVTDFVTPWSMDFMTLTPSAMGSENDPFHIVIKAFDGSSNAWQNIYDSNLSFADRKKEQVLILNNAKSYNKYSVLFERKSTSASLHLGQYGIIETYLKGCTAELHGGITGSDVSLYKTVSPTESPTIKPTSKPTAYGYEFTSPSSLTAAVNTWKNEKSQAIEKYGQIEDWNTRKITSMSNLFADYGSFNEDISRWDVSNVSKMLYMFYFAESFNCDLSKWDVRKVDNMKYMFGETKAFDQKLCWTVSEETDVEAMFTGSHGSIECD